MTDLAGVIIGGMLAIVGGFASNWWLESSREKREQNALHLSKLEEAYGLACSLPGWGSQIYLLFGGEILRLYPVADAEMSAWMEKTMDRILVRSKELSGSTPFANIVSLIGFHHDVLMQQVMEVQNSGNSLVGTIGEAAKQAVREKSRNEAQAYYDGLVKPALGDFNASAHRLADAIRAEARTVRDRSGPYLSYPYRRKSGR